MGWYEWRDEGGARKQKYQFYRADQQPLLMAGIWFQADALPQLVTLTTQANTLCQTIHSRMPVFIEKDAVHHWLQCDDLNSLVPLMMPIENDAIQYKSVH